MTSNDGEEQETQWMLVDPIADTQVLTDADGKPLPQPAGEDAEAVSEDDEPEDDDNSVNVGALRYAKVQDILNLPLTEVSADDGQVVLRADKLPKGTIDISGKDLSKKSSITVTLADHELGPYVAEYVETLEKPVRMRVVARVKEYERRAQFGWVDGKILPLSEAMSVGLSAMGNEMAFGFSMTYTHLPCESA